MADKSKIEWTDATWNPVTGCTLVSEGCRNCYAARLAATRLKHHASRAGLARLNSQGVAKFTGEVRFNDQWLDQPLRWRRPRMVFVAAHADLFAEAVPDDWIDQVFAVMALAPRHTFQVLTKRPQMMREYCSRHDVAQRIWDVADAIACDMRLPETHPADAYLAGGKANAPWPLPNVWLGVSIEDQAAAGARIPDLLATPAAVRFASYEPALGPVDFNALAEGPENLNALTGLRENPFGAIVQRRTGQALGWVIAGGESGAGARPAHPDWFRSVRDQCAAAGVAFFFKQWGAWAPAPEHMNFHQAQAWAGNRPVELHSSGHTLARVGKALAGRLLDGREHNAMPVPADE